MVDIKKFGDGKFSDKDIEESVVVALDSTSINNVFIGLNVLSTKLNQVPYREFFVEVIYEDKRKIFNSLFNVNDTVNYCNTIKDLVRDIRGLEYIFRDKVYKEENKVVLYEKALLG